MKRYQLHVEVERLEDGDYFAVCSNLEGCHALGETVADAIENVEDAARVIIELCLEKGLPLPPELSASDEVPVVTAEVFVTVQA